MLGTLSWKLEGLMSLEPLELHSDGCSRIWMTSYGRLSRSRSLRMIFLDFGFSIVLGVFCFMDKLASGTSNPLAKID